MRRAALTKGTNSESKRVVWKAKEVMGEDSTVVFYRTRCSKAVGESREVQAEIAGGGEEGGDEWEASEGHQYGSLFASGKGLNERVSNRVRGR